MSILKKLRETHNLSQKQLAEEINVDLKNLEKWEKSPKNISNNDLSSIAYYFGLSSEKLYDAIIGNVTDLSTNKYHIHSFKNFLDGWWGHIGIRLNNQSKPQWFPITVNTANRVSNILANYESRNEWIVLDTLNNRTLAFDPSRLKNIWLLDENADLPSDDWVVPDDYEGMPGEFYKALEAYYMEADGIELGKNEEVSNYSKKDIESFTDIHDLDSDLVRELMTKTHIYNIDGSVQSHIIEAEKLAEFILIIQLETAALLDFSSKEDGYELYIPSKNVSLIDMPKRYVDKGIGDIDED